MNININIKFNFFKPRKKKKSILNPLHHIIMNKSSIQRTKSWCVGGKHKSDTKNIMEYEKVNPKTKKLIKIIKGTCSIRGRNKSQIFTK